MENKSKRSLIREERSTKANSTHTNELLEFGVFNVFFFQFLFQHGNSFSIIDYILFKKRSTLNKVEKHVYFSIP